MESVYKSLWFWKRWHSMYKIQPRPTDGHLTISWPGGGSSDSILLVSKPFGSHETRCKEGFFFTSPGNQRDLSDVASRDGAAGCNELPDKTFGMPTTQWRETQGRDLARKGLRPSENESKNIRATISQSRPNFDHILQFIAKILRKSTALPRGRHVRSLVESPFSTSKI